MKKILLFAVFCLPIIGNGQDIPLTEKKVTTEKMENEDRRLIEKDKKEIQKASKLEPLSQMGFISNPLQVPFGMSFFIFKNNTFGLYGDIRSDFRISAPGKWQGQEKDIGWIVNHGGFGTGEMMEGGYNIFNAGVSLSLFRAKKYLICLYVGYGISQVIYFEKYETTIFFGGGPYFAQQSTKNSDNYNIGLLFQNNSVISWQIGYDSSVPGINVGIGFNFKYR